MKNYVVVKIKMMKRLPKKVREQFAEVKPGETLALSFPEMAIIAKRFTGSAIYIGKE